LLLLLLQMVREGTDVSIFTYSRMRYVVMQAVAELEKKGYNPEVGRPQMAACARVTAWTLGGVRLCC
jgi:hypothetical protein